MHHMSIGRITHRIAPHGPEAVHSCRLLAAWLLWLTLGWLLNAITLPVG